MVIAYVAIYVVVAFLVALALGRLLKRAARGYPSADDVSERARALRDAGRELERLRKGFDFDDPPTDPG